MLLAGVKPSHGQQIFTGNWKIVRFVAAPWADPARYSVADNEAKGLIGKAVSFRPKIVTGPRPLGCRIPHYDIRKDDGPDMLFQGVLAEADYSGKKRDPAELARALGVMTPTIQTLSTGCSEVEFHMVGPNRLMFGLNNRVYFLDRAGSS